MARKNMNTTIDEKLYKAIKFLALELDIDANDLLEEGMKLVLEKYGKKIPEDN